MLIVVFHVVSSLQTGSIFEVKQNELLVLVPQNVVTKNERSVQTNFSLFGHSKQYCWVSNPKCNKKFVFFLRNENLFW